MRCSTRRERESSDARLPSLSMTGMRCTRHSSIRSIAAWIDLEQREMIIYQKKRERTESGAFSSTGLYGFRPDLPATLITVTLEKCFYKM